MGEAMVCPQDFAKAATQLQSARKRLSCATVAWPEPLVTACMSLTRFRTSCAAKAASSAQTILRLRKVAANCGLHQHKVAPMSQAAVSATISTHLNATLRGPYRTCALSSLFKSRRKANTTCTEQELEHTALHLAAEGQGSSPVTGPQGLGNGAASCACAVQPAPSQQLPPVPGLHKHALPKRERITTEAERPEGLLRERALTWATTPSSGVSSCICVCSSSRSFWTALQTAVA